MLFINLILNKCFTNLRYASCTIFEKAFCEPIIAPAKVRLFTNFGYYF